MATLNLSTNGPSISKSYQSIINSGQPSGPAANSSTYGQWAVYSVSTPLLNAFQQGGDTKESVLKVQSTGEGELVDLLDEFSDGKVQFAFLKIRDTNTTLSKYALIGWCGEGVPERTKGYFTSHQAAVSKLLHGYHVQITARSDRDLTPESIVQKVADASGSKYSADGPSPSTGAPKPTAPKPAFTPTQSSGGGVDFNVLASRRRVGAPKQEKVDEDGWGEDAPQITRTQLEKVQPAYQPTKVEMRQPSSQQQERAAFGNEASSQDEPSDVVRGGYQPIGKVDIAAIRRQAQTGTSETDDRPTVVKGAYEPVGKVDIAAIRARVQQPSDASKSPALAADSTHTGDSAQGGDLGSLPARSAVSTSPERLTSLPKPKVSNRFGSNTSTFIGTKPPAPGGFGLESNKSPTAPPIGASRTFADEGGKTPAQIWAEKKARHGGNTAATNPSPADLSGAGPPISGQSTGSGEWKSGYTGKSWAPVKTTQTGQSARSFGQETSSHANEPEPEEEIHSPSGGVSAIKDRFKDTTPIRPAASQPEDRSPVPPPFEISTKPNAEKGAAVEMDSPRPNIPTPPPQARSPTPSTPSDAGSPIQVAMPVRRTQVEVTDAHEDQLSPPTPVPVQSLAREISRHEESDLDEEPAMHDGARAAASAMATSSFGQDVFPSASKGDIRALALYDYEKVEDNELELHEGEHITNIDMLDEDWWMGQNSRGESGLFPSNYVEVQKNDAADVGAKTKAPTAIAHSDPQSTSGGADELGATATALYDYDAAEDNELTFPEGAKISNVEFPDADWWSGEYGGHAGLFPANYVRIDE